MIGNTPLAAIDYRFSGKQALSIRAAETMGWPGYYS